MLIAVGAGQLEMWAEGARLQTFLVSFVLRDDIRSKCWAEIGVLKSYFDLLSGRVGSLYDQINCSLRHGPVPKSGPNGRALAWWKWLISRLVNEVAVEIVANMLRRAVVNEECICDEFSGAERPFHHEAL